MLDYFEYLDPDNIWRVEQNKPSLVVRDLKFLYPYVDEEVVYKILLGRGIFKWWAVIAPMLVQFIMTIIFYRDTEDYIKSFSK